MKHDVLRVILDVSTIWSTCPAICEINNPTAVFSDLKFSCALSFYSSHNCFHQFPSAQCDTMNVSRQSVLLSLVIQVISFETTKRHKAIRSDYEMSIYCWMCSINTSNLVYLKDMTWKFDNTAYANIVMQIPNKIAVTGAR